MDNSLFINLFSHAKTPPDDYRRVVVLGVSDG
jgi:hypothetical protein